MWHKFYFACMGIFTGAFYYKKWSGNTTFVMQTSDITIVRPIGILVIPSVILLGLVAVFFEKFFITSNRLGRLVLRCWSRVFAHSKFTSLMDYILDAVIVEEYTMTLPEKALYLKYVLGAMKIRWRKIGRDANYNSLIKNIETQLEEVRSMSIIAKISGIDGSGL